MDIGNPHKIFSFSILHCCLGNFEHFFIIFILSAEHKALIFFHILIRQERDGPACILSEFQLRSETGREIVRPKIRIKRGKSFSSIICITHLPIAAFQYIFRVHPSFFQRRMAAFRLFLLSGLRCPYAYKRPVVILHSPILQEFFSDFLPIFTIFHICSCPRAVHAFQF